MRTMHSALVAALSLTMLGGLGGVAAAQQEEGELMGFEDIAMHDGALEEWTSDPSSPVESVP